MALEASTIALADPLLLRDQAYIDGEWSDSDSGATFAVTNPATGEPITLTGCGSINITYKLFGDNFGATSHAIPYAEWCPGVFPVN